MLLTYYFKPSHYLLELQRLTIRVANSASNRRNMSVAEEVQDQLDDFRQLTDQLKSAVNASTSLRPQQLEAAGAPALTGTQRAQFILAKAQAIQALYHLLLRTSGKDPHSIPNVTAEMERLKQYKKKVNRMVAAAEMAVSRPSATLDMAAASRFIDHAIPDLTQEQREKLKQVNQRGKRLRQGQQGSPQSFPSGTDTSAADEPPTKVATNAQQFMSMLSHGSSS